MSEETQAEKQYRLLIDRLERKRLLNGYSTIIFYFSFNLLLYGAFNGSHIYEFFYIVPTIGAALIMFVGGKVQKKAKKLELNEKEKLFFKFYRIGDTLDDYSNNSSQKNKNLVFKSMQKLTKFTSGWITKTTPSSFRQISESISKNLESLATVVENNDTEKISDMKNAIHKISMICFKKEPDLDDLKEFQKILQELYPISVKKTVTFKHLIKKPNKYLELLKENSKWVYIVIGVVGLGLFFIAQVIVPEESISRINTILSGAIAIAALILFLYDRNKKINSKTSNSVKDRSNLSKKSYDIEIPPSASEYIDNPYVEPRAYTGSINQPIIWQNNDGEAHSVTSGRKRKISKDNDVEDGEPDDLFDKILNPHDNFEFTFKKEGTYHYYCKLHKCSEATIVIENS